MLPAGAAGGRQWAGALQQPARLSSSPRSTPRRPGRAMAPCCRCPAALRADGAAGGAASRAQPLGPHGRRAGTAASPTCWAGRRLCTPPASHGAADGLGRDTGCSRTLRGAPSRQPGCRRLPRPGRRRVSARLRSAIHRCLTAMHRNAGHRPQCRWPQQAGAPHRSQEREPLCQAAGEGESVCVCAAGRCLRWFEAGGVGPGWCMQGCAVLPCGRQQQPAASAAAPSGGSGGQAAAAGRAGERRRAVAAGWVAAGAAKQDAAQRSLEVQRSCAASHADGSLRWRWHSDSRVCRCGLPAFCCGTAEPHAWPAALRDGGAVCSPAAQPEHGST